MGLAKWSGLEQTMPLILAVEPDRKQADAIAALARGVLRSEVIVTDSADSALTVMAKRVPNLLLTSLLLPPRDEARIADRLREMDTAGTYVQTLVIPVFASATKRSSGSKGNLTRIWKSRPKNSTPDGCAPEVFAAQISEYLQRAAADNAARAGAARVNLGRAAATDQLDPFEASPIPARREAPEREAPEEQVSESLQVETAEGALDRSEVKPVAIAAEPPSAATAAAGAVTAEPARSDRHPRNLQGPAVVGAAEPQVPVAIAAEPPRAAVAAELPGPAVAISGAAEQADSAAPVEPGLEDDVGEGDTARPMFVLGALDLGAFVEELRSAKAQTIAQPAAELREATAAVHGSGLASRAQGASQKNGNGSSPSTSRPVTHDEPKPLPGSADRVASTSSAAPALQPVPVSIGAPTAPSTDHPRGAQAPKRRRAVQDEWGIFDPQQAGFAALFAKLEEITEQEETAAEPPAYVSPKI
jgi:CheY-like chemotaxis protein